MFLLRQLTLNHNHLMVDANADFKKYLSFSFFKQKTFAVTKLVLFISLPVVEVCSNDFRQHSS